MFFGVTASFQGVSASVLYGAQPRIDLSPRPVPADSIIDVEARTLGADDKTSNNNDRKLISTPVEAVTYAAPARRGQPPRLLQNAPSPGRLLDVYA